MHAPPSSRGPSPLLPLAYLVCAAAAFLLASIGVAWLAPELAGHYYHPHLLALTHTVTLGWITLAIMGASYQLIPIVLERPIWSERLARWQLVILVLAVLGMVPHFYLGTWPGLAGAAALLAVGVVLYLLNVGLSLRGFSQWTLTARLVTVGYAGLAATTLFGLTLAVNRIWPFLPSEFFPTLHAHVQLALLGWVTPMILGVAARVYPMFLLAPTPRRWASRWQLWGLALGVPSVVAGLLIGLSVLLVAGALAVAAAALAHASWVLDTARSRKRPGLDWGLRFVLTATAFVVPASGLGLALATGALSGPRAALAYAVVVLGGWASLTIVGMMLKIVPFLVWYRAYSPRAGRERVPSLVQISSPRLEALAYALLTGGVGLLAVAVSFGEAAWIRAAGLALALGAAAFAAALGRILGHLFNAGASKWPPHSPSSGPGPTTRSAHQASAPHSSPSSGPGLTMRSAHQVSAPHSAGPESRGAPPDSRAPHMPAERAR
ncbi:MAG TPA: hypothetical protein VKN16_15065 [Methylomirabilota bacterium]|nr:hypothetical protein [Methylomirabilota bacterium]